MCENPVDIVEDAVGGVVDFVEDVGGGAVDAVESIGGEVVDAVDSVGQQIDRSYNSAVDEFERTDWDQIGATVITGGANLTTEEMIKQGSRVGKSVAKDIKRGVNRLMSPPSVPNNVPAPVTTAAQPERQRQVFSKYGNRRSGNSAGGTVLTSPLGASSMSTGSTVLGT